MSNVFDLDSEVLPIESGPDCLWSPPEKAAKSSRESDQQQSIKFSPPTSKEAYQRIRSKYQVALSVMDKGAGVQVKRTQVRRRQSFAISQMLQNVSTITSTPLKLGQLDTEKLVETMKQSAIKQSALKRKSVVPRSCRKSRAQVLRRVSKNIDDIFASHFAEGDADTSHAAMLVGATPHCKSSMGQNKGVQLLERFDDDPFHHVELMEGSPDRIVSARPSLSGLASTTATKSNFSTSKRACVAPSTPQRNNLCSPQPSRMSMSHKKSLPGSAIKHRDTDFNTSAQKPAPKPPVPSSTPTRVLASNRKSMASSTVKQSLPGTPTRGTNTNTPAGRTPLAYYTAAASARRPTMPTPAPSATTPQRRPVAMTCSALKLKQLAASTTPLSTLRNTIQTQVHLSVEKMGALLQSMKKNDKNKHAALTVSKARESSPGVRHTAKKSSTARVLDYSDAPSATFVERTFVYDADEPQVDQELEQEEAFEDVSGMLDEVLDINIEAMLQDYAASDALAADRFSDAAELPTQLEFEGKAEEIVEQEEEHQVLVDAEEPCDDIVAEAESVPVVEECVSQSCAMDVTACEMDVTSEDMDVSTYAMDCTACSPAGFALDTTAMDVDSPGPASPTVNQTLVCEDDRYASDSSSSPQIVRVRYSTGRRSLSNVRGRVSLGATDCLALAAAESTSPLVFTAPAAPSDLLSPAIVNSARADLSKCLKAVVTPSRSLLKGPVRLLSATKAAAPTTSAAPARSAITPQAKHRFAYNSDSDNELSLSCQSTGKKVIRNVNQHNANGRRKSLSCASSASVSNLLKNFQVQKEVQGANEQVADAVSTSVTTSMTSIPEASPRLTRSAVKSTSSALKAKELMAQSLSPRREKVPSSTQKKSELVEQVAEVVENAAILASPAAENLPSTKKGRKSTAKKSAKAPLEVEVDAVPVVEPATQSDAEIPVSLATALSPLASGKKTTAKKSVLKALTSPTAAPASTTRSYSLRSAAKNVPVDNAVQDSARKSNNRTVKTLFPDEPEVHTKETESPVEENENTENAAPSNSAPKVAATPLGKPMRVTATAKKLALKTPQGLYTAAKVKRQERNQKLDALFGTCEELLSLIDTSVL